MSELRTHHVIPTGEASAEWERLVDADPHASVFQTPRYLRVWHHALGQRYPIRVHTVHDGPELIGVVADANDRAGGPSGPLELRRFAGGTEVTDYLGPVSRPDARVEVADAYVRNLVADVDWDEFIAGGLVRDSAWGDALRRAVDTHGLRILHEEIEDVCPRVDLDGGHRAYVKRLSGRYRQELNRKTRKLAREVGNLELATRSAGAKESFFRREDVRAWFHALAGEFAGDRTLRLHRLEAGGATAASTVSLVGSGQWGLYNSGFDPELAPYAPGTVIVWMLIEQACDEELEVFDLLRGAEEYKYRFGAEDRELERMIVGRR